MIDLFLPARSSMRDGAPSRRTEDPGVFTTAGIYSPLSDFWYTAVGKPTSSRVRVTDDVSLTYSAVWACTRILAGTLGGLPLQLCEREADQSEIVMRDDNRNRLVEHAMNDEMNAMMARSQAAIQQINGGNCYFEIERVDDDPLADIVAYWPLHRSRVRVKRGKAIRNRDTGFVEDVDHDKHGNDLYYEVKNNDGSVTIFDPREVLHFPSMMSDDGISGKGVITYSRETIGMGLATERYGAKWFGTGGVPRVAVTLKGKMSDDAKRNFRKEWKEIYGGADGDLVGVLSEGATITPMNISMDDAQFLGTRGHNIEEMCRWYGCPVHMVQRTMQVGINGIENIGIEFLTYTMLPWCKLWIQELHRKTLRAEEQENKFYRYDFAELLRMDAKTRAEYIRVRIQVGTMTPNEGRRLEGDNPYKDEAADKLYMQGAMVTIENVGLVPNLPAPDDKANQQGKDAQGDTGLGGAVALIQLAQGTEQRIVGAVAQAVDCLRIEFTQRLMAIESKPLPETIVVQQPEIEDNRTPAFRAAARVMLVDAADKSIRKEVWAARQAAKKPGTFLAWLDKFYGEEFTALAAKLFAPPCQMLVILGIPASVERIVSTIAADSRDELLTLSGACGAAELAAKVEECVVAWESAGAEQIAESVMGDK